MQMPNPHTLRDALIGTAVLAGVFALWVRWDNRHPDGPSFWLLVRQTLWLILLSPFLLIGGLLSRVGHLGKRSGYEREKR
jgi:hypothetical protein